MNFVNSNKSPLSEKSDVAHGVDREGWMRKRRSAVNNSKRKHKKCLKFHQNSLENEIIFAKRWRTGGGGGAGVRPVNVKSVYVYF